jgi:hypothetical protein
VRRRHQQEEELARTLPNKALQLTPNSWPQSRRGGILAAAAQAQR